MPRLFRAAASLQLRGSLEGIAFTSDFEMRNVLVIEDQQDIVGRLVVEPVVAFHLLHSGRIGNNESIVLILAETGLTFRFEHAHNLAGVVADSYDLTNGIFGAE